MGLFDSFFVEIGGHEVELQTKRFDSVMACYRPGDAEATRRLKAGEEPLEVLGSLLADEASGDVGLGFAGPFQLAESDPLAPYRL